MVIAVVVLVDELMEEGGEGEGDRGARLDTETLVEALVTDGLLSLMHTALLSLDETNDDDKEGVFKILSVLENICSISPALDTTVCEVFLEWMVGRLKTKEFDSVKAYVAELLAILLQSSTVNRKRLVDLGGLDILLKIVSQFRKKDPVDPDTTEFVENVFDCLCGVVSESILVNDFIAAEGVELILICLRLNIW